MVGTAINRAEISSDTPVDADGNPIPTTDADSTPDTMSGDLDDVPGETPGDDSF